MGEVMEVQKMQPDDFYDLVVELWGDNWAVILANKFDVRPKSVRRWASGENPIPEAVIAFVQFFHQRNGGGK